MMEKFQNRKWLKIGLLAVAGLILATGLVWAGYKIGRKQVQPTLISIPTVSPSPISKLTPTPKTSPTPTVMPAETPKVTIKTIQYTMIPDWTRYDNISGGYSIQYNPAEYGIVDENKTSLAHSIIDGLEIPCITPRCQTGIWINIYSNYKGGSRLKWLEEFRNIARTERYLEDVVVQNKKALITMDDHFTEIAIPLNNRMISVTMKGPFYHTTQKKPFNIEFVYQFLSTFRFLPSVDSTGSP